MTQANPQLRAMLTNPQFLQQQMTPENIAMAQSMMQGGGFGGMGAMGGGAGSMQMPGGGATSSTGA